MATQTQKILIIDDDTMILKAYETIIASDGYQVRTASDGQEGLDVAAKFQPDLIVLDILMPVMDGITFLRNFKPKQHQNTKVVVLSNSASAKKLKGALELGAVDYIIKTEVKPEDIKTLVKHYLATS